MCVCPAELSPLPSPHARPVDKRSENHNMDHGSEAALSVDAFLNWVYQNLAEPLAEGEVDPEHLSIAGESSTETAVRHLF
jgi:hypothetical protein